MNPYIFWNSVTSRYITAASYNGNKNMKNTEQLFVLTNISTDE